MDDFPHAFEAGISLYGLWKSRVITCTVQLLPLHILPDLPFDPSPRLLVEGGIAEPPADAWREGMV